MGCRDGVDQQGTRVMNDGWEQAVAQVVKAYAGQYPDNLERVAGGFNNIGVRVEVKGLRLFAKCYFRHAGDPRNRLATEFGFLRFVWDHGIRCVPEPLVMDEAAGVGLYARIEGKVPEADSISRADAGQMAGFLVGLNRLARDPAAGALPPASESAFQLSDYLAHQDRRWARLESLAGTEAIGESFRALMERMSVLRRKLRDFVATLAHEQGMDPAAEFPRDTLTLSPADHGFHNTLRREGALVFLDFEYAGWDDPAQMIANACHQSRLPVPAAERRYFIATVLESLPGAAGIAKRLRIVYPLVGFKWALILLNEFLPVSGDRRRFAGEDPVARREEQLAKSARQCDVVERWLDGGAAEWGWFGSDTSPYLEMWSGGRRHGVAPGYKMTQKGL